MRCSNRSWTVFSSIHQLFQRGNEQGHSILAERTLSKLVQKYQRTTRRVPQSMRDLTELNHEA